MLLIAIGVLILSGLDKKLETILVDASRAWLINLTTQFSTMTRESVITCPQCGAAKSETMPTDACQFFYRCTGCGTMLKPKPGDCCVFCSYGSVPCPPMQAGGCRSC